MQLGIQWFLWRAGDGGVSLGGTLGVMGSLTCSVVFKTTADDQRWTKRQAGSAAEWRWKGQALGSQKHTG